MAKNVYASRSSYLSSPAFTIVELLIVIVIIAILAAVTVIAYTGIQNRAAQTVLQSDLRNAATKLGTEKALNDAYPATQTAALALLTKSQGTSFQYAPTSTGYCLTATSSRTASAYHISSSEAVSLGACSGHTATDPVTLNCPPSFLPIPGNPTFGTSDFCVMKYEARNAGANVPISTPTGTPWTSISQTNAITYSQNVSGCSGCHLITEPEWMTIAANVLSVPSNWSGGSVGSGYLYSGHNDNSPASPLTASSDDNDGYINTGNAAPSGQRRTLTLTNGEVIWDFAGDVWEWTDQTTTGAGNQPGAPSGAGYSYREWNVSNIQMGSFSYARPSFGTPAASGWTSTQGVGTVYASQVEPTTKGFIRGGYYNSGSNSGVFMLFLNDSPATANAPLGFRVAK